MKTVYSMVLLDIDGTLLDSRQEISPNTKRLLCRLEGRGIPVILCSARNPAGIERVAREAGLHGPIVCYGGSLVLAEDRSILLDTGIQAGRAVRFKGFVAERFPELCVSTYLYDVWLVDDAQNPYVRRDAAILRCEPLAGDLEDAVRRTPHVHKLLCSGPPGKLLALQRQAEEAFPDLCLVSSGAEYLEVLKAGVSKRSAAEALQRRYGLPREALVACGDHFVDLELLRYAGLGVAMGNAPEPVKAAADRVTASNDGEGVYIALKTLRFAPPPGPKQD